MLKTTAKAEKSRIEAGLFFTDLKRIAASFVRKNPSGFEAAAAARFYNEICELEKSLSLNINLSLLFCTLVSRAEKLINS